MSNRSNNTSNEKDSIIDHMVIDLAESPQAKATRDKSITIGKTINLLTPKKLAASPNNNNNTNNVDDVVMGATIDLLTPKKLKASPNNNNNTNNVDDVVMGATMNPHELAVQGTELKSTLKGPMIVAIQKYVAAQETLKEVLDTVYGQSQRYMSKCKKSNVAPDQEISDFVNDWSDLFYNVSS